MCQRIVILFDKRVHNAHIWRPEKDVEKTDLVICQ